MGSIPQDIYEDARDAWPGVAVSSDDFAAFVGARAEPGEARGAAVLRLRPRELYIACACAARDPAAIARFEARYFGELDAALARFRDLPLSRDDVTQRVREKLFLATPPAIASYGGYGDLGGFVRALSVHLLLNIASRESRERPTEGMFFDAVLDSDPTAEAQYLKHACRAEFEAAFGAAMSSLTAREKTLLRYAFTDGQSVDRIGAIYRVHRATAARWVAAARDKLVDATRKDLMARLDVSSDEAASIVRAALSGVGTTLLAKLSK